jgi:hypothetical protein
MIEAAYTSKTARFHNPKRHHLNIKTYNSCYILCGVTLVASLGVLDLSEAFLCSSERKYQEDCSMGDFSSAPPAIFFVSFLVIGVGTSVYHTLGVSYLDDNVRKNKTPFLLGNTPCIKIPCINVNVCSHQNLTSLRVLYENSKHKHITIYYGI